MTIYFVTSSRSDFGLIRPIIKYIYAESSDQVALVCLSTASELDDSYLQSGIGGFPIIRFPSPVKERSLGGFEQTLLVFADLCKRFSEWIARLTSVPDWFFVPGDRFEIFAAVIAAYYSNVPVAHIFGGDRSEGGHLDDNVRHAITKLAHVHFAVCEDSSHRILNLGEEPWRVHNVGSPVVESVNEVINDGHTFSLDEFIQPRSYNLLCTYHPITTEPQEAASQFASILQAFEVLERRLDVSFIVTYPNNEYGSGPIIDTLRTVKDKPNYFIFEDLGWRDYLSVMSRCDLVVGNSSSGMLEAPIVGVPSLDIGMRQKGRFSPPSVCHVQRYDASSVASKIEEILGRKQELSGHPYGEGTTSEKIWKILCNLANEKSRKEILQKKITY